VVAGDLRGADEAADDGGEGGGRVAGVFFPALLVGDGGVADQEAGGALDEGKTSQLPRPPAFQMRQVRMSGKATSSSWTPVQ
jgi:hypothetical protein